MAATVVNTSRYVTPEGVETKPLFLKNLSLQDWDLIRRLMVSLGGKSMADTIRFCIRKTAGVI